ncbi:MAG TPA: hypothetical protein VFQ88_15315 [Nevskiaceae bacterium]|nr:hypothetical protein [Nevskiaceae bacterium]
METKNTSTRAKVVTAWVFRLAEREAACLLGLPPRGGWRGYAAAAAWALAGPIIGVVAAMLFSTPAHASLRFYGLCLAGAVFVSWIAAQSRRYMEA